MRKALGIMERSHADALTRQPSGQLQEFFAQLTANREFAGSKLYDKFMALLESRPDPVFRGMCFGLRQEDEERLHSLPYERQLLRRFTVFNSARDWLERSGHGCFLRKDDSHCWLMGIFDHGESPEEIVREAMDGVAQRTGFQLRVGLGRACTALDELSVTYQDSLWAYNLYYFDQQDILCWERISIPSATLNERISGAAKSVFQSIVAKSDRVLDEINTLLDGVATLHRGNRSAAYNRVMIFTGDLCQLLFANRLLDGSFSQRQDTLQHRLEDCETFTLLRERLLDYYRDLLPEIYHSTRNRSAEEILRVRRYIEENYDKDLSLKSLAEVTIKFGKIYNYCHIW